MPEQVPIIDVGPLTADGADGDPAARAVADRLGAACREHGFFYVRGHGVSREIQERLEDASRRFFELDLDAKLEIPMASGGRAWRGYFPVGEELTSGRPDLKEGLYFGSDLGPDDPRVRAGLPMHGANLFPSSVPELRAAVSDYMDALTGLGFRLMAGLALSLGLPSSYFADRYLRDPLVLFRIFHYPPAADADDRALWGVGEHTDYGVLTILKQDEVGGLQVRSGGRWIEAPPIPDTFICNIGDMLDRMTRGLYRSTPHRVRNTADRGRYSFPFFFDPDFDAEIRPIELPDAVAPAGDSDDDRWDGADVHRLGGTYGDYVLSKVSKVFPQLRRRTLGSTEAEA